MHLLAQHSLDLAQAVLAQSATSAGMPKPVLALLILLAIPVGLVAVIYLLVHLFKALGCLIRRVFSFIGGELGDALRIVGAAITLLVFVPLVLINVLIGRWSAAAHFGRAIHAECAVAALCVYRIVVGHPARLLGLTALTDGLEKRLPAVVAASPGADAPNPSRAGQFEGYTIVGSLPGGGSGGKLYVAEPDAIRRAGFERAGQRDVRQVVIKTFSLRDGSSLPQIVRESRALDAAKRLGLVLDHELTAERFFYVMRYVPGESLGLVTQRLHAACDGSGLDQPALATAMGYGADLLRTLQAYNTGGLWHKDVKPDNIIVDGRSAHLVDFGLVTPLRSAMTLTTHGTEYFRDPEMVRQALKGVKVDQVDGAKFDVYAAGAVLFSVIENSFPAHGGLSQITKRCPEALRWVVRRAMTDYDKRYGSAGVMLADLDYVRHAADPYAVKPFELPSMRDVAEPVVAPATAEVPDDAPLRRTPEPVAVGAGSDQFRPGFGASAAAASASSFGAFASAHTSIPPAGAAAAAASTFSGPRRRPKIRVSRWWTGGYVADDGADFPPAGPSSVAAAAAAGAGSHTFFAGVGPLPGDKGGAVGGVAWVRRPAERSAQEQVQNARQRAAAARDRARSRMHQRRGRAPGDFRSVNVGVGFAVLVLLAAIVALFSSVLTGRGRSVRIVTDGGDASTPAVAFSSGLLPEAGELPPLSPGASVATTATRRTHRDHRSGQPRIVIDGHDADSITPAEAASVSGESALVISDISPATPAIESAVKRLKTAGFSLVGNFPGNTAGPGEIEHQLGLEADARRIRDVGSLEDDAVSRRLAGWLAGRKDVNMLVWFANGGEEGTTHFYVVTPSMVGGTGKTPLDAAFNVGMEALAGRPN